VLAFFSRIPRCVVGLEACATAHYWARKPGRFARRTMTTTQLFMFWLLLFSLLLESRLNI
jgi:hypothetical protein